MSSVNSDGLPRGARTKYRNSVPFLGFEECKKQLEALDIPHTFPTKSDGLDPKLSLPDDSVAIAYTFESCAEVCISHSPKWPLRVIVCWPPAETGHNCEESLFPQTLEINLKLHRTLKNLRYFIKLLDFVVAGIRSQPRAWIDFREMDNIGKCILWPEKLRKSEVVKAKVNCRVTSLRDLNLSFSVNISQVAKFQVKCLYELENNAMQIARAVSLLNQRVTAGHFIWNKKKKSLKFVDRTPLHCIAEENRQEALMTYCHSMWEVVAWVLRLMRKLRQLPTELILELAGCMLLKLKNAESGWIKIERKRREFDVLQELLGNLLSLSSEINNQRKSFFNVTEGLIFLSAEGYFESVLNNLDSARLIQTHPAIFGIYDLLKSIEIFPAKLILYHNTTRIDKVFIAPADIEKFSIDKVAGVHSRLQQSITEGSDFLASEKFFHIEELGDIRVEGKISVGSRFCSRLEGKVDIEERRYPRGYCNKVQFLCRKLKNVKDEMHFNLNLAGYISHPQVIGEKYSQTIKLLRRNEHLYLAEEYCNEEQKAWDLKGLLKVVSHLRNLHSAGYFHWFLSPLTIRQYPEVHLTFPCLFPCNAHFLSSLFLGFTAYQAPEVRSFIETGKVVENPQAADVFSLCALISGCRCSAHLVTCGLKENPQERPRLEAIENALKESCTGSK